jgi:hypothetical protein
VITAPRALPPVAAEAPPPPLDPPVALRFAAAAPAGVVRAELTLPDGAVAPAIGYAAYTPPADEKPASPEERAERPAAKSPARAERRAAPPAEARRVQAQATPPASSAGRERLERSVENMLRDRLLAR